MRRESFFDLFKVPVGMWLIAFAYGVQLSPGIQFRIKGGVTVCIIYAFGMILCASGMKARSFFADVGKICRGNSTMVLCLFLYYFFVFSAWCYAPYKVHYFEVQSIWKFHVLNFFALFIGMFLTRNPRFIRFVIVASIPLVFLYAFEARNLMTHFQIDARDADFNLGSTTLWESIALYSIMLLGFVMTERNYVLKGLVFLVMLYIDKAILSAGYATPFALLLGGHCIFGFCYLRYGKKDRLAGLKKIGLMVLLFVVSIAIFLKLANSFERGEDDRFNSIAQRFYGLKEDPRGGGYDVEHSRFDSMAVSWEGFLNAPLFGNGGVYTSNHYELCGNHQAIVDFLSMYGIVGAGAYYIFLFIALSNIVKRYKITKDWFDCASVCVGFMFFMGGVVNPCWYGPPMTGFLVLGMPFKDPLFNRLSQGIYPPYSYSPKGNYGRPFG